MLRFSSKVSRLSKRSSSKQTPVDEVGKQFTNSGFMKAFGRHLSRYSLPDRTLASPVKHLNRYSFALYLLERMTTSSFVLACMFRSLSRFTQFRWSSLLIEQLQFGRSAFRSTIRSSTCRSGWSAIRMSKMPFRFHWNRSRNRSLPMDHRSPSS